MSRGPRAPASRAVAQTLALGALFALALFGGYGGLGWPAAWAFLAWFALHSLAGFALLPRELIAERSRIGAGSERADLVRAGLAALLLFPGTLFVCGLDVRLAGSPPLPLALRAAAGALFVAGHAFALWAAHENPFFSGVVRIQRERGHRVVDSGPYAFVRHPGYAGGIAAHLALPLAFGSLAGLAPAALGCGLLAWRAVHEERRLARELAGYAEYEARVRFRLVPRVW